MNKFKYIILIDDDEAVTFYNNYILTNAKKSDEIIIANNVDEAVIRLTELNQKGPDELNRSLALIDVNMPKYNGFELIEKNHALFKSLQEKGMALVFLSTSSNPNDINRVKEIDIIETFLEKPIDLAKIDSLNYLFES